MAGASCFRVFSTESTSLRSSRWTRAAAQVHPGRTLYWSPGSTVAQNLDRGTREGFEAMNQALKARVEESSRR